MARKLRGGCYSFTCSTVDTSITGIKLPPLHCNCIVILSIACTTQTHTHTHTHTHWPNIAIYGKKPHLGSHLGSLSIGNTCQRVWHARGPTKCSHIIHYMPVTFTYHILTTTVTTYIPVAIGPHQYTFQPSNHDNLWSTSPVASLLALDKVLFVIFKVGTTNYNM